MLTPAHQDLLRRLTLGDERTVQRVMGGDVGSRRLDDRMEALVRLASLVPLDTGGASFRAAIDACHAAGAERDHMLAVIDGIASIVGPDAARAAAAALESALGVRR